MTPLQSSTLHKRLSFNEGALEQAAKAKDTLDNLTRIIGSRQLYKDWDAHRQLLRVQGLEPHQMDQEDNDMLEEDTSDSPLVNIPLPQHTHVTQEHTQTLMRGRPPVNQPMGPNQPHVHQPSPAIGRNNTIPLLQPGDRARVSSTSGRGSTNHTPSKTHTIHQPPRPIPSGEPPRLLEKPRFCPSPTATTPSAPKRKEESEKLHDGRDASRRGNSTSRESCRQGFQNTPKTTQNYHRAREAVQGREKTTILNHQLVTGTDSSRLGKEVPSLSDAERLLNSIHENLDKETHSLLEERLRLLFSSFLDDL